MFKRNKPEFIWNEELGTAVCILKDKQGNSYKGKAQCHEADRDMMSEKTGLTIALYRAELQAFVAYKKNELEPAYKALKQLYYSINKSKQYNEHSYEARMLRRQMFQKEEDLAVINSMIKSKRRAIDDYLTDKEEFYTRVRARRATNRAESDKNR